MKYAFITSMNEDYYNHCGRLMLSSYQKKMRHPLYVYNEDFIPRVKDGINCMHWNLGKEYEMFQERWKHEKKISVFAKKGFSIIHAMNNLNADYIIWLDADTHILQNIHPQLLDFITSNNTLSAHFGVKHEHEGKTYFSCETGFFLLNKKHKNFENFKNTYTDIYVNDDYKNLRRFYDGEVYGETVLRLQKNTRARMLELNPNQKHKTPIPRSVLAPYIAHYKAGLKDTLDIDDMMHEYTDEI